jgi:hypothetical protein
MFFPKPRRANYTMAKAYSPINLSSFMLKMMEKLVDRHIRDEFLGLHPYINTNLPTKQGGHCNCTAPCDYTYTGSSGKQ